MLAWPDHNAYNLSRSPRALVDLGIDRDGARAEHQISQTIRHQRAVAGGRQNNSRHPRRCQTSSAGTRAVSKDELRSQVQKLERVNAALRAKNRQANRAAKLSAARITELEDEVARLRPHPGASTDSGSAAMPKSGPQPHDIDPGDAVPPGVAPEDPGLPDQEAETARETLELHLRGE